MKIIYSLMMIIFIPAEIMAQVALPYGITPVNGEIRLLYKPGFESRCSASAEGEDTPSTGTTTLAINSVGSLSYHLKMDGVTAIFDINEDGFGSTEKSPLFEAENSTLVDSKIADSILAAIKTSPPGYGIIGKTLRQGSNIEMPNVCAALPGAIQNFESKKRRVIGTTNINGRSSLIVRSDFEIGCTVQGNQKVSVGLNGWESLDLQSGLLGNSIGKITIKLDGAETNIFMKNECIISQLSTSPRLNGTTSKTVEQRLFEIKSLMDKGLITKEQYDQKRVEFLKLL